MREPIYQGAGIRTEDWVFRPCERRSWVSLLCFLTPPKGSGKGPGWHRRSQRTASTRTHGSTKQNASLSHSLTHSFSACAHTLTLSLSLSLTPSLSVSLYAPTNMVHVSPGTPPTVAEHAKNGPDTVQVPSLSEWDFAHARLWAI